MKKRFLIICLLGFLCGGVVNAQQFVGYAYNNYEAVGGAIFNPASIAGSRYSLDINLFSFNAALGSTAYEFDRKSILKNGFDNMEKGVNYHITDNDPIRLWTNIDILGPSFMFRLNRKSSLAVTSRLRVMVTQNNFSRGILQALENSGEDIFNQTLTGKDMQTDVHSFANVGLTYARTILENEKHALKAGVTANYILGLGGGSVRSNNLNVNLQDEDQINSLKGDLSVVYSQAINDYFDSEDFSFDQFAKNTGFGFDFGVVYEMKKKIMSDDGMTEIPDAWKNVPSNHWLRFALSVTDVGSIKYKISPESKSYTVNVVNTPYEDIKPNDDESLDDYLERMETLGYFSEKSMESSYKMQLPTMLRANIDFQATRRVYVNFNASINMVSGDKFGAKYLNYYTVTPRFESKWVGVFSPISLNGANKLNWGVGINMGIFYVGSGSTLSNLFSKNLSETDVFFGLHIPLFKSTKVAGKSSAPSAIERDSPMPRSTTTTN